MIEVNKGGIPNLTIDKYKQKAVSGVLLGQHGVKCRNQGLSKPEREHELGASHEQL